MSGSRLSGNGFHIVGSGSRSVEVPNTGEYHDFDAWWVEHAKTLNTRATLTWVELAWAGWYARSEIAEGKSPTVFQRRDGD